jgi:hypothetical protein
MNTIYELKAVGLDLTVIPPLFPNAHSDWHIGEKFSTLADHRAAISDVQRFRGRVYIADGALPPSALDEEDRHYQEFDFENYHLCLRDTEQQLRGCFRLRLHEPTVEIRDLALHEVIERMPSRLGTLCHGALASLFALSQKEQVGIGEVGGWAVDQELRHRRASILLPFAAWSLYEIIGHAIVLATATNRHHSSTILKRIGGFTLMRREGPLPCFMDDFYNCGMELLGFDSRKPHPKYEEIVADLKDFLLTKVYTLPVPQCNRRIEEEQHA